jgi:hypothetical protein
MDENISAPNATIGLQTPSRRDVNRNPPKGGYFEEKLSQIVCAQEESDRKKIYDIRPRSGKPPVAFFYSRSPLCNVESLYLAKTKGSW